MEKRDSLIAFTLTLMKHTDQDHVITRRKIQEKMNTIFHISCGRKMIYRLAERLNQIPYFKVTYDESKHGYCLNQFYFTKGEILLLVTILHLLPFLSASESDALIAKLLRFLPITYEEVFTNCVYNPNSRKTANNNLITNIEIITQAVSRNTRITFDYLHYNTDKQLITINHEPISAEPRFIIYQDNSLYLVATGTRFPGNTIFRLDKITNLSITDEPCSLFDFKGDATEYAERTYYMFAEDSITVEFLCHNDKLDYMIETFGKRIIPIQTDADHFRFTALISHTAAKLIAMRWADHVEILSPSSLRKELADLFEQRAASYRA